MARCPSFGWLFGILALGSIAAAPLLARDRDPPDGPHAPALDALEAGRRTFRFDTFGDEAFWGGTLRLHEAINGAARGGVGQGLSPQAALELGLKVDVQALPPQVVGLLRAGKLDLTDPGTTLALLRLDAVVGVKGFFDESGGLASVGITCALCHSTVDDSFAPGIGRRLDGWANRDLNVGRLVSLAPNLRPIAERLGTSVEAVREVLMSWGPGRYDAVLLHDGKAFRPDGKTAAVLLPPAFGLAGVERHTYTGFGSVTYWNAYVAVTQMHGQGSFYDLRLNDPQKYPFAVASGEWNVRADPDLVTAKLPALHLYQLSLAAPKPPAGSFDAAAAARGEALFAGKAQCATCHVPPLYTEPGSNLHPPADIGIDGFQAERSPEGMYRTTPLKGLWTHQKGGFYHDGRFPTLSAVIEHYDRNFRLGLTDQEKAELAEYLKSL
ncbi:MAG TPA: hypothetical protein VF203_14320 [Burkholderiales bacterium]